jgi:hypothetical protein
MARATGRGRLRMDRDEKRYAWWYGRFRLVGQDVQRMDVPGRCCNLVDWRTRCPDAPLHSSASSH